ncbi:hypothetical protein FHW12_001014 [Dokdonella fugitiva]|uniref:Uncharacterized protein n=1 Tax=Dokdonella fugitiva TaxID=328517 RepID=A0A839EW26_9GAMM|nr:hypothetical protein [Dokdonella fugitiva]
MNRMLDAFSSQVVYGALHRITFSSLNDGMTDAAMIIMHGMVWREAQRSNDDIGAAKSLRGKNGLEFFLDAAE